MSGSSWRDLSLFLLQAFALLGVLVRIRLSGLNFIYPYFFSYLLVQTLQLAGALIDRGTDLYGNFYFVTEALIVCFYALVVLELYGVVLREMTGIATTAKRYIRWSLVISITVSLLLLEVQRTPITILGAFFTFERTIVSSLLVFVALITAFLLYYPIPLNRNVIYYTIGYSVYFSCRAIALFLANSGAKWVEAANLAAFFGPLMCLLFWIVCLRRDGETSTMVLGHQWNSEDRERVMAQLKAINATLSRVRD